MIDFESMPLVCVVVRRVRRRVDMGFEFVGCHFSSPRYAAVSAAATKFVGTVPTNGIRAVARGGFGAGPDGTALTRGHNSYKVATSLFLVGVLKGEFLDVPPGVFFDFF